MVFLSLSEPLCGETSYRGYLNAGCKMTEYGKVLAVALYVFSLLIVKRATVLKSYLMAHAVGLQGSNTRFSAHESCCWE